MENKLVAKCLEKVQRKDTKSPCVSGLSDEGYNSVTFTDTNSIKNTIKNIKLHTEQQDKLSKVNTLMLSCIKFYGNFYRCKDLKCFQKVSH